MNWTVKKKVKFVNSFQNEGLSPSGIALSFNGFGSIDSPYKYSEADIKGILGFLVDNIFVVFGDQVFQQSIGIPMGTNSAPLLADLFLYSYEAEFVQKLLQDNNKKLAVSFNHTFRYIDDVLSINNHNFHKYVHFIYPDELEMKDTT
jgi:hypothetical protein